MIVSPAIIISKPKVSFRLLVNDGKEWDCGGLPKDFAEMPLRLRLRLIREVRSYLPEPFRDLSDGMLAPLLANIGGLPGVLMAGGIKTAYLYTASSTFSPEGDWNQLDNVIQGVGAGGNGRDPLESPLNPGQYYGGAGGGGAAWAALINAVLILFSAYAVSVGTSAQADTSFDTVASLLAVGGRNGGTVSGGSANGGQGGQASACVGNLKSSGSDGEGVSGFGLINDGGHGGGAGGPNGDATANGDGDAGFGGPTGSISALTTLPGGDGVDGPGGGWLPGNSSNAGSGGGGGEGQGTSGSGADPDGHAGGRYGGAGGGAGVTADPFQRVGSGGAFAPGCLLIVNNASL